MGVVLVAGPKIDQLIMCTSEIKRVEFNTLRDEITIVIPEDFDVLTVHPGGIDGPTEVRLTRRPG